jgi:hypothetical protein
MKQWVPTPSLRWLKQINSGATLMQLHYCYEIDDQGFCGAKIDEKWKPIEVVQEDGN